MLLLAPGARTVERSAKKLDKVSPGWEGKIRPETLDISTSHNCVLGQIYGSWSTGLSRADRQGVNLYNDDTFLRNKYRDQWLNAVSRRLNRRPSLARRGFERLVVRYPS